MTILIEVTQKCAKEIVKQTNDFSLDTRFGYVFTFDNVKGYRTENNHLIILIVGALNVSAVVIPKTEIKNIIIGGEIK